jgi:SAM-dependent methyltransferase
MDFHSLLDVGGAEGYRASMVAEIFAVEVRNCDLSEQACKRAKQIFNIDSDVVDMHSLPYADSSFDVVLCSESLEHVTDFCKATNELVRVARKAVIITVPHESEKTVNHNLQERIPHAHIHSLDAASFDFLKLNGHRMLTRRIVSPILKFPSKLLPIGRQQPSAKYPGIVFDIYNGSVPLLKRVFGKRAAAFLIRIDTIVCRIVPAYEAMVIVVLKDHQAYKRRKTISITPMRIIEYEVPYLSLQSSRKSHNEGLRTRVDSDTKL